VTGHGVPIAELYTIGSAFLTLVAVWKATRDLLRADRRAFWTTLKLCGVYVLYASVSVGIVVTLLRGPQSTLVAVAAATFIMTWIGFGSLWLARMVPREDPLPSWLGERFGYADWMFLAVVIASLAYILIATRPV
jgi:hypothetical protein